MKSIRHLIGYSVVAVIAFVVGAGIILAVDSGESASAIDAPETRTITSAVTVTKPGSTTTTTAPPETTTETKTATVTAEPPAPETAIPGDGTFEVGVDIEPGTYVSKPPDRNCYWARLSDGSGDFNNIIDNNNSSGQSLVTIAAADRFFETSGCSGWTKR